MLRTGSGLFKLLFLLAMLFCINLQIMAQKNDTKPEDRAVDMDAPTFEPMVRVGKVLLDKDSIQYVQVNNVYVYPQPVFKNAKERMAYNRLVYNIKKVLPIAKEVRKIIIETGREGNQGGIHSKNEETHLCPR